MSHFLIHIRLRVKHAGFARVLAPGGGRREPDSATELFTGENVAEGEGGGGGSRRALLSERLPRPHWKRLMEDPASRPKDPVTWLDRGRVHR